MRSRTIGVVVLASLMAAGLGAAVLAGSATPGTSAAYTDTAKAVTPSSGGTTLLAAAATYTPTKTYLANTATALQDGALWIWGFRGNGLSGTGVATVAASAPPSVAAIPQTGYSGTHRRYVVKVAGVSLDGFNPTDSTYTGLAALSDDGIVYTWGGTQNANIMGRDATVPYSSPGAVSIPGKVVDLVSSASVFMALTATGDLYTWGYPQGFGATGQGAATASSSAPARILTGVHSIGAGVWNGWAIRGNHVPGNAQSGVLWWGRANHSSANAGDPSGDNGNVSQYTPIKSAQLSTLATSGCASVGVVAGSKDDTCTLTRLSGHAFGSQAVTSDGKLYTWGNRGEFGTGRANVSAAQDNTPTYVPISGGTAQIAEVAVTTDYVMLLDRSGSLYIYGRYSFASGPNPTTGARSTIDLTAPTRVTALSGVVSHIGGFGYSGAARQTSGSYFLWGGSTQRANNNTYFSVRDGWATVTTPSTATQGITTFVQPGK